MKAFLYIWLLFIFVKYSNGDAAKTSGKYKSTIIRAEKCNQTTYNVDPEPPVVMSINVYNSSKKSSMIGGNVTVSREVKHIKFKTTRYIWQNGHWKLLSHLNNIGCHGVLFHTLVLALGIKYNRETCAFLKGQYTFHDMDADFLEHLLVPEMEYGRVLRVAETTRGYATYTCWEFETLVEPL